VAQTLVELGGIEHRNLSGVSTWTPNARGIRPVCLSGMAVSAWWSAFCDTGCDKRGPTRRV